MPAFPVFDWSVVAVASSVGRPLLRGDDELLWIRQLPSPLLPASAVARPSGDDELLRIRQLLSPVLPASVVARPCGDDKLLLIRQLALSVTAAWTSVLPPLTAAQSPGLLIRALLFAPSKSFSSPAPANADTSNEVAPRGETNSGMPQQTVLAAPGVCCAVPWIIERLSGGDDGDDTVFVSVALRSSQASAYLCGH
eukprot:6990832-Pyramimonas_sp.AAC.2